jgi:hypothetical protein
VFESGWFWAFVLFLLPAGVTAAVAWRSVLHPGQDRERGSTWARVIAVGTLSISMLLCAAIAIGQLREKDPGFLPTAVGLMALAGANVWLLMVRPRWAAISLACSALLLPLAVSAAAPLFVVDPHDVLVHRRRRLSVFLARPRRVGVRHQGLTR